MPINAVTKDDDSKEIENIPTLANNTVVTSNEITTIPSIFSTKKFESKLGVYEQAAVCSDKDICSKIGR